MKLTEHFTTEELSRTDNRQFQEKNFNSLSSDEMALDSLKRLCVTLLEPIREKSGHALVVHSAYRCRPLNMAVGGSPTSQHIVGEACDFHIVEMELSEVFEEIQKDKDLRWGQLILEGTPPQWIHISLPTDRLRGQVKRAERDDSGKWVYTTLDDMVNFA